MSTHLIPEPGKKTMMSILNSHDLNIISDLTRIDADRIKEILKGAPSTGSEGHKLTAAARSLDYERPGKLDLKRVKSQYALFRGNK